MIPQQPKILTNTPQNYPKKTPTTPKPSTKPPRPAACSPGTASDAACGSGAPLGCLSPESSSAWDGPAQPCASGRAPLCLLKPRGLSSARTRPEGSPHSCARWGALTRGSMGSVAALQELREGFQHGLSPACRKAKPWEGVRSKGRNCY